MCYKLQYCVCVRIFRNLMDLDLGSLSDPGLSLHSILYILYSPGACVSRGGGARDLPPLEIKKKKMPFRFSGPPPPYQFLDTPLFTIHMIFTVHTVFTIHAGKYRF